MLKALLPLCAALSLCAQDAPHLAPLRAKATFENVAMPFPGETMGLTGLHLIRDFRGGLYLGLSSYGSLTGVRGGFITAGATAGYRLPLGPRVALDAGFHAGGGGAGRAAVGGGLMLRSHAGLDVRALGLRWGAEYARVRFPNGRIDSESVAFSLALPFRAWVAPGRAQTWSTGLLPASGWGEGSLALTAQTYRPRPGTHLLDGPADRETVGLVGFTATADLSRHSFLSLEMAAAGHGKADGYMEIMVGAGLKADFTPGGELRGYVRLSTGPAGGGNLDVGGGTAFRGALGLELHPGGPLMVGLEAGYLTTPGGSFKARTLQFSVGRTFTYARPGGAWFGSGDRMAAQPWRLDLGSLRLSTPQRRAGAAPDPVDLVAIHASKDLNPYVYLTGAGAFAMTGKAGGFGLGLVGLGLQSPALGGRLRAFAELLAGAAGGGGVDTGGGAVALPMVGLDLRLGRDLSLQLRGGHVKTRKGSLSTGALEASLAYRFSLLEKR